MINNYMNKICYRCKRNLDINDFGVCKSSKDGKQSKCKQCSIEMSREWRRKNSKYLKEYYKENTKRMKGNQIRRYRSRKSNEPWYIAYCTVKQRARDKQLDFDLDSDYVKSIWADTCPVLGIPLYCAFFGSGHKRTDGVGKARPRDNSPTIDRIDSNKGYVKGNVCIMSYRANMIKNCGTLEEHKRIVAFMENHPILPATI